MRKILSAIAAMTIVCVGLGLAQATHPSQLEFPALDFDPPDPQAFRTEFANGLRAYVQEDRSLPLFNIAALVNFGGLYVPREKTGLEAVLSSAYIRGGTGTRDGEAIEERIDFLGGMLSFNVGERVSTLSLSVLSKDLEEGLTLFFDVLMNPAFRDDAFNLARARLIEQLRQANDQPAAVLSREYEKLIYGDHPLTWQATRKTYENVTAADLKDVHERFFFPENIILTVSGDFEKSELKTRIDKIVSEWKNKTLSRPSFSTDFPAPEPGVYFIQRPINQGYVSLGHLGVEDTNPDYFAIQVMNFILGGGSFTSRIVTKVRSDEGLSYSQGSRFTTRWGFPGTFSGFVQTKSSTVGYAISLILDEFRRIRSEPVTDGEMETAINFYVESFAGQFEMPQQTMRNFAMLEMQGKPSDYYRTYRSKIEAVTKERVQEVAQKYIQPEKAAILIVGDWEPCNEGGEQWPGPLEKLGKVRRLALTDPMTGKEIKIP